MVAVWCFLSSLVVFWYLFLVCWVLYFRFGFWMCCNSACFWLGCFLFGLLVSVCVLLLVFVWFYSGLFCLCCEFVDFHVHVSFCGLAFCGLLWFGFCDCVVVWLLVCLLCLWFFVFSAWVLIWFRVLLVWFWLSCGVWFSCGFGIKPGLMFWGLFAYFSFCLYVWIGVFIVLLIVGLRLVLVVLGVSWLFWCFWVFSWAFVRFGRFGCLVLLGAFWLLVSVLGVF